MIRQFHFVIMGAWFSLAVSITGQAKGDQTQHAFFEAVRSGDSRQVMSLMHPLLVKEVDEPVLAAWIAAVNERLGPVQSVRRTGFAWGISTEGRRSETTAEIEFARGRATSKLVSSGGKLISFGVQSDELKFWFQGPASTDVYQRLGQEFITAFLSDHVDVAYGLMHPALQQNLGKQQLREMMQGAGNRGGALRLVQFEKSTVKNDEKGVRLFLDFTIECENTTGTCEIEIQFEGMKGHLLGFRFR